MAHTHTSSSYAYYTHADIDALNLHNSIPVASVVLFRPENACEVLVHCRLSQVSLSYPSFPRNIKEVNDVSRGNVHIEKSILLSFSLVADITILRIKR